MTFREGTIERQCRGAQSLWKTALLLLFVLGTHLRAEEPAVTLSQRTIATVQPRMVKIFGAGGLANLQAFGTGFLVSADGHIATVWSHVLDSDVVTVVLADGRRFLGKVVSAIPEIDLAVLKIEADGLSYFNLAQPAAAGPGTRVLGISNMFKVATGDEWQSVLHGVIAARTPLTARRGRFEVPYRGPVFIVDAITNNSGAAGGALVTYDGRLLGMIGRELRNAESNVWINYAIPIAELAGPIEDVIAGRSTAREQPRAENASTGYVPGDFGLVLVPDVVHRTPAFIEEIQPDSLLSGAGLQPDDLIVFVNDELVHSIRSLEDQLSRLQAEDDLSIVVRRGGELIPVQVTVPRKESRP
ncbi:MAG: S1C family serine protease [Planctomycetaceae bacterium]